MKKFVLIVAGGSGNRMKSDIPKQFCLVLGKPLLYYTLLKFYTVIPDATIVIVIPEIYIQYWTDLVSKYNITIPHKITEGGPTRFHSVRSGLNAINELCEDAVIGIHDGVRPFVSSEVILNGFKIAEKLDSAIPVVSISDSVREISGSLSNIFPRERLCIVQTPQFFKFKHIFDAYQIAYSEQFLDDAGVLETTGRQVNLIDGNRENIKITYPTDILYAESLIQSGWDISK